MILSKDPASHLVRLEAVFWTLAEVGPKLKPSKCKLFQWQIAYLGHMISTQGIATNEGKIDAIIKWPIPPNITEIQSFLGFMGHYCQFIPKFVQVAQPLHELTSGENADKKKAASQWHDRSQQASDDLKKLCITALFLFMQTSPDISSSTQMLAGLVWGLSSYQTHKDGMDTVIAYASRSLTKVESHYPVHKLNFSLSSGQ